MTSAGYTRPLGPRPKMPAILVLAKAQAFANALARRGTVREFSNRPVPPGVVEAAVRAAGTAPGAGDPPPWTIVAASTPEARHRLRLAAEAEPGRDPGDLRLVESAPVTLAVLERGGGKGRTVHESVGLGIGFLLTTLYHAGLTAVTEAVAEAPAYNEILNRPPTESMFMLIAIGYPLEGVPTGRVSRRPLDEVLYWR